MVRTALVALVILCAAAFGQAQAPTVLKLTPGPLAGEKGGPGLALRTRKALTVPLEGVQHIDDAIILIKDGKIAGVGPARTMAVPAGFEVLDVGRQWVMPGMIDLHSHIGGTLDINEMVYLTNPGLRVSASVVPAPTTWPGRAKWLLMTLRVRRLPRQSTRRLSRSSAWLSRLLRCSCSSSGV